MEKLLTIQELWDKHYNVISDPDDNGATGIAIMDREDFQLALEAYRSSLIKRIEEKHSDYVRIRDGWKKGSKQYEAYDLLVREYAFILSLLTSPEEKTGNSEEWAKLEGQGLDAKLEKWDQKTDNPNQSPIFIDGDFNDSYEARIRRGKAKYSGKYESGMENMEG